MKKMFYFLSLLVVFPACLHSDNYNHEPVNAGDRVFALRAAMGSFAEVQEGMLVISHSTDTLVISFAKAMIADHSALLAELHTITNNLNIGFSDSLDIEHSVLKSQLMSLSGNAFDSLYIASRINDYYRMISLDETEKSMGSNVELQNHAGNSTRILLHHLKVANALASQYQ